MNPDDKILNAAALAAAATERATTLPAPLSLAQWAVESGWGQHAPGNNCFGIKTFEGSDRQLLNTTEWLTPAEAGRFRAASEGRTAILDETAGTRPDGRQRYHCTDWFASFKTLTGAFTHHALLIVNGKPYAKAFSDFRQKKDTEALARAIAPIYATDPDYGEKLITLMRSDRIRTALSSAAA